MTDRNQKVVTTGRELVVSRTFQAPRELVFAAYSNCEHLRNWWGPRTWPMVECTMDFRVGGTWHYCLRGPKEGDESWGLAVFDEIIAPERLVYTDSFSDATGKVNEAMPTVQVHLDFVESGGRTQLTMRGTYRSPDTLKQVLDMGMIEGLTETLDRLDEYLARQINLKA